LGGVDHQGPFDQSDPGQAARYDVNILTVENVRPQVDVAAFEYIAAKRRNGRKGQHWLSDVIARIAQNLFFAPG
jgi:hypothetical protein